MRKILLISLIILLSIVSNYNISASETGRQQIRITMREIEPFTYASVRHQGPFSEIESAIRILMSNLGRQNIAPAGTVFAIFHQIPEEGKGGILEWEVGFPVTAQVLPQPPLVKGQWSHKTVASVKHTGPIETISSAVDEMMEWLNENDYTKDGSIITIFNNIGSEDIVPSRLETEIMIACKKN